MTSQNRPSTPPPAQAGSPSATQHVEQHADRMDSTLTGLTLFEAYARRDDATLSALMAATAPGEAVQSLLASMELALGMFASQIGADVDEVIESVRRRIVQQIAVDRSPRTP